MARIKTFTVNADSVQEGATITFKALKRGAWEQWLDPDSDMDDAEIAKTHIVKWTGIEDDSGHELPSPAEDAAVIGELYMHELQTICRLLAAGPNGENAKN